MPFPFGFAWLNALHTVRHSHRRQLGLYWRLLGLRGRWHDSGGALLPQDRLGEVGLRFAVASYIYLVVGHPLCGSGC
jgi:hypothetical protein